NEQRETKEIITPIDKHRIIMKTYITGGEDKMIKRIWQSIEMTVEGKSTKSKSFNMADKAEDAEKKVVELIVVSINEKTESIVDTILNMKKKDCKFIEKEIEKITEDEDEDKKKV
ncbi:MAG: hypothetical protein KAR07_10340, partial [Spirochaetes bacterium]|nr:hypothetical protein [Spirochaetota bacterium]